MKIYVNTFVFKDEYNVPMKQEVLFPMLAAEGFNEVELRREYIKDIEKELPLIEKSAKQNEISLLYAVVDTYYKEGILDKKSVNQYIHEAKVMGAKTLKLMPGDFTSLSKEDSVYFNKLEDNGIQLLLENGQKSTPETMKAFVEQCEKHGIDMKITFDLGNWVWSNQDIPMVAEILKPWVYAVHLKDGANVDGSLKVVPIGEGVTDWKKVVDILSPARFALEYGCGANAIENMKKELSKL
ncbi:MAG: TIM barrel protein [Lachnospiraceae bacterium]|nr:TIM barrel protein [Lachnospiraceae bacterium]